MNDQSSLKERAANEANLPPFCTIVEAGWLQALDPKTFKPKQVLCARFTFPGATDRGFWRADLRDMATVEMADYDLYQQLKADWLAEKDERS